MSVSPNSIPCIFAIATMDTKGAELHYVAQRIGEQFIHKPSIREQCVSVKTVDVSVSGESLITSRLGAGQQPDVTRQQVLDAIGRDVSDLAELDRGAAVELMAEALTEFLLQQAAGGQVAGVIGLGGSGGTALITSAMRALDMGLPKLMVSTVASGNTAPYIDCSDITMMYSVVDIAGLNRVSRKVLTNAAHAIAGMASSPAQEPGRQRTVGMTMFGVTTVCVNAVRELLEPRGFECLVFHATGTGGRTMERLVQSGLIEGVLDLTTTEVADEIAGGIFPCGSERFDRLLAKRIPMVFSFGALDMVNFGARHTVPDVYKSRKLHVHNANVTLMRTNVEENRKAAKWIAEKLNQATSPWTMLIPRGGVSALDIEGGPFYDPEANHTLFDTFLHHLRTSKGNNVVDLPYHINDPKFAAAAVDAYLSLLVTK